MNGTLSPPEAIGRETYNASVLHVREIHEALVVLRVQPDGEFPDFQPGQYTILGLHAAEPRSDGIRASLVTAPGKPAGLIHRAYSFSCPLLDEHDRLASCDQLPYLEFYIALVGRHSDDPPMLSPRLFALRPGQRLYLGPHPHGRYTLDAVQPEDDVLFLSTGTGEAPHNAMIAHLLKQEHQGQIVAATCVRYRFDLAYLREHRQLERLFANYHYYPLTTREPENLDATRGDYVGKRYLQDFVRQSELLQHFAGQLDPERTHAFVCGNPAMIGLPKRDRGGELIFPEPPGVVETLIHLGLQLDEPHSPGSIHFEKYW